MAVVRHDEDREPPAEACRREHRLGAAVARSDAERADVVEAAEHDVVAVAEHGVTRQDDCIAPAGRDPCPVAHVRDRPGDRHARRVCDQLRRGGDAACLQVGVRGEADRDRRGGLVVALATCFDDGGRGVDTDQDPPPPDASTGISAPSVPS